MKSVIFCVVIVLSLHSIEGRVFTRCELAKALSAQGFPRHQLPDWVCLVESESSRNTHATGGPNTDGSYDYGLFQINSKYWCKIGSRGNGCNVDCNRLLNDDISEASACAQRIYREFHEKPGFKAWYGWINKCQGRALPDLRSCGI